MDYITNGLYVVYNNKQDHVEAATHFVENEGQQRYVDFDGVPTPVIKCMAADNVNYGSDTEQKYFPRLVKFRVAKDDVGDYAEVVFSIPTDDLDHFVPA
jgi:hypothetical protein